MKILVLGALLLSAVSLFPQPHKKPSGTPGEIKESLMAIERKIGQANLNCDYDYFSRIEAEEFIFTDSSGKTSNKQEDLSGAKDCRKSDATYDLDDMDVRLYAGSAVVTGRVTITRKDKEGKTIRRQSRFTDVFEWINGMWQIVAGHSSRIPDPAAK